MSSGTLNAGEYLSVLVSIIIGLGLSHLLGSVGKLLSRRRRVRTYVPAVAAAVLVFLAHVQFWWGSFDFGERIESNFFAFIVFLLTPILLYLIAVLVLPELDQDDSGEVSLREHYYEARPWFYGLSALIPVTTAIRNAGFQGDALWNQDRPFEAAFFLVALTGALTASERVHRILPFAMLALFALMVVLTSLKPG
jgi:fumarate reductase subunit D